MNLAEELNKLFLDHPEGEEAKRFIFSYGEFCHSLDDIIDEKITDAKKILPCYMMHMNLLSSLFYNKYQHVLYPVLRVVHHTWADSIEMEYSDAEWKKLQADTLKGIGIEVTLTVIEILGGYSERRRLSILVREDAYNQQHKNET